MSRFFINRPIFATVLSLVIVIAGLMASRTLPIAQNPEIAPPTVTVTATYPGASAETLAKIVAAPIEEQLNGVENMLYFNSTSSSVGTLNITMTFEIGTNGDQAAINVNNRVQLALPRLPDEVRRTGVIVQKRSNDILMFVALRSPSSLNNSFFAGGTASFSRPLTTVSSETRGTCSGSCGAGGSVVGNITGLPSGNTGFAPGGSSSAFGSLFNSLAHPTPLASIALGFFYRGMI